MTDDAVRRIAREIDALVRVVAPIEHPPGAASLVLTFRETGIGSGFCRPLRGFSADGLDRYAAWLRRDDSLAGRPVFAVGIERILDDSKTLRNDGPSWSDVEAATEAARGVSLHELAHAVQARLSRPREEIDPEAYPDWLRKQFSAIAENLNATESHGPGWWRTYVVLVARAKSAASKIAPVASLRKCVATYGYGKPEDADEWIAAAATDPGYLDAPLAEIPSRSCPGFDELLARVRPAKTETLSAAASQAQES